MRSLTSSSNERHLAGRSSPSRRAAMLKVEYLFLERESCERIIFIHHNVQLVPTQAPLGSLIRRAEIVNFDIFELPFCRFNFCSVLFCSKFRSVALISFLSLQSLFFCFNFCSVASIIISVASFSILLLQFLFWFPKFYSIESIKYTGSSKQNLK